MLLTVKTSDFKNALRILNDSLRKGLTLFLWIEEDAMKLRVYDPRFFNDVREIKINLISLEKDPSEPFLLSLDGNQVKELKRAVKYYKDDHLTFEVKKNENYKLRLPRVLEHKLVVNGIEIEV